MSLDRIKEIENISLDTLFQTELSNLLYDHVRIKYSASSLEGKLCRRILKKFQALCKSSADFVDEELPEITDVSDEEAEQTSSVRSFRSLFRRDSRQSIYISGQARGPQCVPEFTSSTELASSTVLVQTTRAVPALSDVFEVSNTFVSDMAWNSDASFETSNVTKGTKQIISCFIFFKPFFVQIFLILCHLTVRIRF